MELLECTDVYNPPMITDVSSTKIRNASVSEVRYSESGGVRLHDIVSYLDLTTIVGSFLPLLRGDIVHQVDGVWSCSLATIYKMLLMYRK